MKAKPLFGFPGGKWRIALRTPILAALTRIIDQARHAGKFCEYREPFLGGASIALSLLARYRNLPVWLNDRSPHIASLWNSVIHEPDALQRLVKRFKPSEDAYHRLKEQEPGTALEQGFRYLALNKMAHNCHIGGGYSNECEGWRSRWTPANIYQRIKTCHKLQQVTLANVPGKKGVTGFDFEEVVRASSNCVLYVDPPYVGKEHYYTYRSIGEIPSFKDSHTRLAHALRESKHPWVLSYNDVPEVRELYKGFNVQTVEVTYIAKRMPGKELVITNR